MKRFLFLLVLALCAGSVGFAQADRSARYVAVQTVAVKDAAGFFAKDLGNLALGDTVRLLNEDGKWSQIQAGNITGWVTSSSLSARRVVASNTAVTASEIAMAGKGFSPDMEMEYRKNGLDYSMVDSMERITVPSGDLLRFITEGRLSRGE
jgi:SH3-like domain-containing protein